MLYQIIRLSKTELHYQIFYPQKRGTLQWFVILPGWNGKLESWNKMATLLCNLGYTVAIPDWPGFGQTPEMQTPWAIDDFVFLTNEFLAKLNVTNPVILGHSHGGRVLIKLLATTKLKCNRIFLLAPAGIPVKLNWKQQIASVLSKISKPLFQMPIANKIFMRIRSLLYRAIGGHDYLALKSEIMRKTMSQVISEDLSPFLPKISQRTTLIWGNKDTYTPIQNAYKMHELLPDSELIIEPEGKHGLHIQNPDRLLELIRSRLN
ncbi:MAG: alpha/beta hydrolase [Patescibacteria group bacterium]|nr:alpha/beta hydrolase [Patescibacteria group bacterium]